VKRLKKMLTFSNVTAVVALFFALGGTVYAAGKISGTQIKAKSIPGNRIKPKSLSGSQIKPGSLTGTQIKAGSLTGTQIKAGSLGGTQVVGSTLTGVTASSIGTVQYVTASASLPKEGADATRATATCPTGMKVIGGGATVSSETFAFINDSAPTSDRSGWSATAFSSESGVTMTTTAICTSVATPTG
jgi:hypothetical protein